METHISLITARLALEGVQLILSHSNHPKANLDIPVRKYFAKNSQLSSTVWWAVLPGCFSLSES